MTQKQLALLGGEKAIQRPFKPLSLMGKEERQAVNEVMETGVLSAYVGSWSDHFYGGEFVKRFEKQWSDYFAVKHAVAVNSNTSGLIAALGAIDLLPGDEVIVSTWSMCASATTVLVWNAIPVFCDIEQETFNMNPKKIAALITPYTKAILVPHIFGHPAALDSIIAIAKKHRLFVIEDCAQVPGALYRGKPVGTLGDIGVYSLNYHKHIHTGEGGMCVTNHPMLAERMQLIRNHAEAVVEKKGVTHLSNMIGFNFRLTELQAAIGIEQLKKLEKNIAYRTVCADYLIKALRELPHLRCPVVQPHCRHVYYTLPLIVDVQSLGISRHLLVTALKAEGVTDLAEGYVNIHMYPLYQKKTAYGSAGFPWTASFYRGSVEYDKGICPVAEALHETTFVNLLLCLSHFTSDDLRLIVKAFRKVWNGLSQLRQHEDSLNEKKPIDCFS